jgi:hypothetical protein
MAEPLVFPLVGYTYKQGKNDCRIVCFLNDYK